MQESMKREVMEYLETLKHANRSVEKAIRKNVAVDLTDAFMQMQEMAIELGNHIESYEGRETQAVYFLEDYCEAIYQMKEALQDGSSEARYRLSRLTAQLKELTAKAEQEIMTSDE